MRTSRLQNEWAACTVVDRRHVLKSALALGVSPSAARGGGFTDNAEQQIDAYLFDNRFLPQDASRLAQARPAFWTDGDVTRFWTDYLDQSLRRGPLHLTGVTGDDVLFVIETLARDRRHEVRQKTQIDSGAVAWIIGPRPETPSA